MITLRLATEADLPALLDLIKQVVPLMRATGNFQWDDQYPNAAVFRQDIDRQQLWIVDSDGHLAGVAALTTEQEAEYAQVGWDVTEPAIVTHRLAVHPAFQGKGIAVALLDQAERVAEERGIPRLLVDTGIHNQATQRLFPKHGYQFAGEATLPIRGGVRVYCYEKQLVR